MKRIYKVLIAVAVMLSVFLCCVFSVSAATIFDSVFLSGSNNVSLVRVADKLGNSADVSNYTFNQTSNGLYALGFSVPNVSTVSSANNVYISFIPSEGFINNIDHSKYYTFVFRVTVILGEGRYELYRPFGYTMTIDDSSGDYAYTSNYAVISTSDAYRAYKFTFSPDQLQNIDDVSEIKFRFQYDDGPVAGTFLRYDFNPAAVVSVSDPTVDEINAAIQQSTDQIIGSIEENTDKIVGGWTPKPEVPNGQETIDDYDQAVDDMLSGQEDGLDTGIQLMSDVNDLLESFSSGFMFLLGLFVMFFEIRWIQSILTLSLAFGIAAFILNLSSSIGAKVGREQRRANRKGG